VIELCRIYDFHRQYDTVHRMFAGLSREGAGAQAIDFKEALLVWQEKGDTSGFHAAFDEPAGPLRAVGRATLLKNQRRSRRPKFR
jgi:hypothetical protein